MIRNMLQQLWQDDGGTVALEYLLTGTVVSLGLVVGLSNLEIALDSELTELSNAITALDQGYNFAGVTGGKTSSKTGSCAIDSVGSQTISTSAPATANINVALP